MDKIKEIIIKGEYFYNGDTNKDAENNLEEMFNRLIKPNLVKLYGDFTFSIINSLENPDFDNETGKGYKISFIATFKKTINRLDSMESEEFITMKKFFFTDITL